MKRPLIGITTYRTKNPFGNPILALGENYVQAISQAGGIPILLPLGLPETQLRSLASKLDGILFSGGGDIDPTLYGMGNDPKVKGIDLDRDRVEIQLIRAAISEGLPFLGICRGLQMINVALKGTLYTDIADQHPQALKHDYYPDWNRDHLPHTVRIAPDSCLAAIFKISEPAVNSLHHQGIRDLAPSLKAVGWAPDDLIEAVERPDSHFGMAVQWHPEWLTDHPRTQAPMRALFQAFVAAAT